jgi:hypothetical protein
MTREEHLQWCKNRAREYLARGDVINAVTSMLSDLSKHEETKGVGRAMALVGILCMTEHDLEGARRFVDGFR